MPEEKYPRGHAYIRIRNAGFTMEMEFRDKNVPFVEQALQVIMSKTREMLASEAEEITTP